MRGTDSDRPNQTSTFKDAQELLDFLDDEGVIYLEDDEHWAGIYESNTLSDDAIDDIIERCNDMDITGGDAIIFSIKTPSGTVYETSWDPYEFELDDDADYAGYYDDDEDETFHEEDFAYYGDDERTGISVFIRKIIFDKTKEMLEGPDAVKTISDLISGATKEDPDNVDMAGLYIDSIANGFAVWCIDVEGDVISYLTL